MTIKVGDKVTGKVTGIVKFGAFVDLGAVSYTHLTLPTICSV